MAARKRVSPKPPASPEGAERADALVDSEISLEAPEASLALLWEIVFDRLCAAGDADVSEVGTLAGIVQKLFSADSRRSAGKPCRAEGAGISAQTLRKIEEKLKLL